VGTILGIAQGDNFGVTPLYMYGGTSREYTTFVFPS
jgi:hypothetical protein